MKRIIALAVAATLLGSPLKAEAVSFKKVVAWAAGIVGVAAVTGGGGIWFCKNKEKNRQIEEERQRLEEERQERARQIDEELINLRQKYQTEVDNFNRAVAGKRLYSRGDQIMWNKHLEDFERRIAELETGLRRLRGQSPSIQKERT